MWKSQEDFVTQILREIKIGWCSVSEDIISTLLEVSNFDFCDFLHILKAEIYQMKNIQSHKNGKKGNLLYSAKSFHVKSEMNDRKFRNFHTVQIKLLRTISTLLLKDLVE